MRDPMAGKYQREYKLEFEIARIVLEGEPGELAWGVHDYEAMTFTSPSVRLIFYPHKTSAGNYHLRIRDQGSKSKGRAQLLMDRLELGSGNWCTFQSRTSSFGRRLALAEREKREFGWAREIAMDRLYGGRKKATQKSGA